MMSTTSHASLTATLSVRQVVRSECLGQHLVHRPYAHRCVHQESGTAVFDQQLPAPPTGHEPLPLPADTGERNQPTTATGDQVRDQTALGAQRDAVRRVL